MIYTHLYYQHMRNEKPNIPLNLHLKITKGHHVFVKGLYYFEIRGTKWVSTKYQSRSNFTVGQTFMNAFLTGFPDSKRSPGFAKAPSNFRSDFTTNCHSKTHKCTYLIRSMNNYLNTNTSNRTPYRSLVGRQLCQM